MACSASRNRLVVDSIHGDIHLTPHEWGVVNTASFQRLRRIKQLGMGHFTYPNATHTRFAHSLGVLGIMGRVLDAAKDYGLRPVPEMHENLRLAALLHDIGHYPYSHVMETLDSVKLTEELIGSATEKKELNLATLSYPKHEQVGALIVNSQADLIEAIGSEDRCRAVADLFTRSKAADEQLSKLIHSSLDMDRLDYLLRDSRAAGVPYGSIDVPYLLNNVMASPESGVVGVSKKALPAAEQFLLARYFMYRAVYYHKTTVALDEACRQLLRRARDRGKYQVPRDADEVREIAKCPARLARFTDAFVDGIVQEALSDEDEDIKCLAHAIAFRRPPKLLKEVAALPKRTSPTYSGAVFTFNCRLRLAALAEEFSLPLSRFLLWEAKPFEFEERGPEFTAAEVKEMMSKEDGQEEGAIKVFLDKGDTDPPSIMDIDHSIMQLCADRVFCLTRLYVVCEDRALVESLREKVSGWDKAE